MNKPKIVIDVEAELTRLLQEELGINVEVEEAKFNSIKDFLIKNADLTKKQKRKLRNTKY